MISATFTIAAILTVALLVISLILVKATPVKSYITYFPGILSFAAGLILLLFATIIDRIWIMGAGLGGWGIACLFAAGITLMVTAVFDSYRQVENT
ncbi:MAG TPA: hypothetical protein VK078_01070 [Pseudogracilibacillus sp.]|nr:hypothetical protein [Pseudogracilibacillus sp.]